MVKTTIPGPDGSTQPEDVIEIELRDPWLAALLAWLLPGLGHLYQGRTGKGILFLVCVLGTFGYGLYLGGGKVVYAAVDWEQQYRWQYLCQLGVGLPATPMLWQREKALQRRAEIRQGVADEEYAGFMAPPRSTPQPWKDYSGNKSSQPNELALWTVDLHPFFELGTVYTVIAGLLNVLVICDAAAGPLILSHPEKKKKEKEDSKPQDESPPVQIPKDETLAKKVKA